MQWFEEMQLLWLQMRWFQSLWFCSLFIKILAILLNIHTMGTSLGHTQVEWDQQNGTFWHYFTSISTHEPDFSIKTNFPTLPKKCKKNILKWKFKHNLSNAHTIYYISSTSFIKYLYFLRYRPILTFIPHFFHSFKFELFHLKNPNIFKLPKNLSWHIIPHPNWSKRVTNHMVLKTRNLSVNKKDSNLKFVEQWNNRCYLGPCQ